uniref:COP9 constitutive photomorphogenic homolog subunit 4 (Arabidopsis) n=1 Tax=Cyprinus carpio TaxID=7962 RepID=A0A8C1QN33_CYPCA
MASGVRQELAQLMNCSGSHKRSKYRQILEKALQFTDAEQLEALKAFVEVMVNENVSLVISRQLLTDFCTHLLNLPDGTAKAVCHFTLEKIQPRVISFEEQVASIRQHLATIYEKEEDWRNAAQVLVGIPLETGQKQYNVDYKLDTYLKIARLYLEEDDPVQAEFSFLFKYLFQPLLIYLKYAQIIFSFIVCFYILKKRCCRCFIYKL